MKGRLLPVSDIFRYKLNLAEQWLKNHFSAEFRVVKNNIKSIYFIEPQGEARVKEITFVFSSEDEGAFGEYVLTPDVARSLGITDIASRLVMAAYMVYFKSLGYSPEMSATLSRHKRQKITDRFLKTDPVAPIDVELIEGQIRVVVAG
jgi:hypothetical protein